MDSLSNSKKKSKITKWVEWSMTPHSFDEIREKCLTDFNGVCFTYLCSKSYISEENFFEFAALSTGLINKDNYNEAIDTVINAIKFMYGIIDIKGVNIDNYIYLTNSVNIDREERINIVKKNKIISKINNENETADDIQKYFRQIIFDRVNWSELCANNNFSEHFLEQFAEYIDWKSLPNNREYSAEFYDKFKNKLTVKYDYAKS